MSQPRTHPVYAALRSTSANSRHSVERLVSRRSSEGGAETAAPPRFEKRSLGRLGAPGLRGSAIPKGYGRTRPVLSRESTTAVSCGGSKERGKRTGPRNRIPAGGGLPEPVRSRERVSILTPVATVCVDDNLSARKTRISLRSADDEAAGRLDVEDGLVVEQVRRDDGLDHLLHKLLLQVRRRDLLGVLGRDDDGVDAAGNEGAVRLLLVLDGDLGLRVGAEPAELSRATEFGHLLVELVREHEGDRHQLRGFCGTEGGESVSAIATQALDSTRFYAVLGSSPLVA
jgi:hypothetical protein